MHCMLLHIFCFDFAYLETHTALDRTIIGLDQSAGKQVMSEVVCTEWTGAVQDENV